MPRAASAPLPGQIWRTQLALPGKQVPTDGTQRAPTLPGELLASLPKGGTFTGVKHVPSLPPALSTSPPRQGPLCISHTVAASCALAAAM